MKNFSIILAALAMVFMISCSKTDDEMVSDPQNSTDLEKSTQPRPFEGITTGVANALAPNPAICDGNLYNFTGEGNVTHLGKVQATLNYCAHTIYGPDGPGGMMIPIGGTFEGTGTMLAANGDELYSSYTGSYTLVYNEYWQVVSNIVTGGDGDITGGTGRFENADGWFNITGEQDMTVFPFNTPTTFNFSGKIIY